jgi:hypothetical protein
LTQRSARTPQPAPSNRLETGEPHRDYALRVAADGFALLAHAMNACDNPATRYRFGDVEREAFMTLCARLYALIETGTIVPRAAAMAQDDVAFQRFVNRSLDGYVEPGSGGHGQGMAKDSPCEPSD